jgi:threonine-phosphate decarboxylase
MLRGHGDNSYTYRQEIVADFSSNVWYGGEPPGLKEHLFHHWQRIKSYPEVLAESLAEKVGHHHQISGENVLINSGSTESIYLLAQCYRGRPSTIVIPSFAEYEDACRIHGHDVTFLHWDDLEETARLMTDLCWIGNPNNPTGAVFPGLEKLIDNNPLTIFIIDEAFIEFTASIPSAIHLLRNFTNLIILRSLTKAFAIPGLRLGYIAADRQIIQKVQTLKMPWSVNAMALEAGHFIFDHYDRIQLPLTRLLQDKAAFIGQLQQTPIKIYDSHTHFFLCETSHGDTATLQEYLIDHHRILIRNAGNFRGLDSKHFRLATLAPHQNQLLINALKEWKSIHS